MDYAEIRRCLANCRFTEHARGEMEDEPLGRILVEEVFEVLHSGEIIEEYPDDDPYPSCLILGWTGTGRPLHIVGALVPVESCFIVITTYQPDPTRWETDYKRRKRS